MKPESADIARCADEPIRAPGAIQPHGRLVLLANDGRRVRAFSENWRHRAELDAALEDLQLRPAAIAPSEAPAPVGSVAIIGTRFDAAAHRSRDGLVVEFESAGPDSGVQAPIYSLARHFLPRLQADSGGIPALAALAAREMKRLTGFGRCLVYRFDPAGHGDVLAEAIDAGYDSYAHHRFPAADIPAQARDLYVLNHLRLIPDSDYVPVPLHCLDADLPPHAIDLSLAALRSVSPVHLEYMRNMGTRASMSVSIVVGGRLWGLISCHDAGPRNLSFQARVACEHVGRLLSLQIAAREANADVAARLELRQLTLQIVAHLTDSDATLQQLVTLPDPLLRLAGAAGAAVVLDDACWTTGEVPPGEAIVALAQWVAERRTEVFDTDRLPDAYPPAAGWARHGAGLLAVSISQVHRHLILWFRPEVLQTLVWAGEPDKTVRADDGRIHPRRSFASWKETVTGRSAPWEPGPLAAVRELRQALIGIVLRRAQEMADAATELARLNKELEAFSYTVSHDLRAPMRHIAGYVDLVIDMEGRQLSERGHRYLAHVKEAAAFSGHLVDALLDFSRMGRAALQHRAVPASDLVAHLVRDLQRQEPGRAIEWQVDADLPVLWADPFLLQVAVRNLLDNACKYSRSRETAVIAVRGLRQPAGEGLEISDNGVGFDMAYADKLFGVFQRLHAGENFDGTGIGLASVRRIVERHGGAVQARGAVDAGATFGFTLPRAPAGPDEAGGTDDDA